MEYSAFGNSRYASHPKRSLEICQGGNPTIVKNNKDANDDAPTPEENARLGREISDRIKAWLKTDKAAKVASVFSISHTNAVNYLKGRVPNTFLLLKIKNQTGVSLDWLLTGKGEAPAGVDIPDHRKDENPYNLEPRQLLFIERMAGTRGVSIEQMVRDVVYAGLDAYAQKFALSYRRMDAGELEEVLNVVLANVLDDSGEEVRDVKDAGQARRR